MGGWVGFRLLRTKVLFVHQLLLKRVILGQLVQTLAAPQVATTVAGPDTGGALALYQQRHNGAAHDAVVAPCSNRQLLAQAPVEPVQTLANVGETSIKVRLNRQLCEARDDQLAGNITALVTAHAVRNHPQSLLGAVEEGIFVTRPHLAGIGTCCAPPRAGCLHQSCTGMRKVRNTPMSNGFGVRWLVNR